MLGIPISELTDGHARAALEYERIPYRKTAYEKWMRSCASVAMFHWKIRAYPNRIHARQPMDDAAVEKLTDIAKKSNMTMGRVCSIKDRPTKRGRGTVSRRIRRDNPLPKGNFGVPFNTTIRVYKQHLNVDYYPIDRLHKRFPATCILILLEYTPDSEFSVGSHVAAKIRGTVFDWWDSPEFGYVPLGFFK